MAHPEGVAWCMTVLALIATFTLLLIPAARLTSNKKLSTILDMVIVFVGLMVLIPVMAVVFIIPLKTRGRV